jgi:hypothetical protein
MSRIDPAARGLSAPEVRAFTPPALPGLIGPMTCRTPAVAAAFRDVETATLATNGSPRNDFQRAELTTRRNAFWRERNRGDFTRALTGTSDCRNG